MSNLGSRKWRHSGQTCCERCLPLYIYIIVIKMALAPLAAFALNPTITGSLLYGLSRAPPQIRERLLRLLERSPVKINIVKLIKVLNWLLAIGLVKKVNDSLSSLALNQWQRKSDKLRWNWPKEIAVVTGGCSGIGAAVTGLLLARGVRVAILDPAPTPPRFQNSELTMICDIFSRLTQNTPSSRSSLAHQMRYHRSRRSQSSSRRSAIEVGQALNPSQQCWYST